MGPFKKSKMAVFRKSWLALCIGLLYISDGYSQSELFHALWNDEKIKDRVKTGIEHNRKGYISIKLVNGNGQTIESAPVEIHQKTHEFLFGANIFMLKGFEEEEKNVAYEKYFKDLFNFASAPFYWVELEPEKGNLRFEVDSKPIYRRPPPDLVLNWCKDNNIKVKGHTLIWDNPRWSLPTWWPDDKTEMMPLIRKRFEEIADRYGHEIKTWDVVNEVTNRHNDIRMPHDFTYHSFKLAEHLFPYESTFILNFSSAIWHNYKIEYSADYLLIQNLLLRGTKLDAIGMQTHFFNKNRYNEMLAGKSMTPEFLYQVLDTYAEFDLPIHITEITFPGLPEGAEGDKYQAAVTENFYKLWFSHPNVEAITWWNLADGTAAPPYKRKDGTITPSEDIYRGGFLDEQLRPKPVYHVLDKLFNEEWKTSLTTKTDNNGIATFKGFYGDYSLKVKYKGRSIEKAFSLSKTGSNEITLDID